MASALLLLCVCLYVPVLLATSLLTDVQVDEGNNTSLDDGKKKMNIDVLRQLVNQETIIRMTQTRNVHTLMKDVIQLKEQQVKSSKEIDSLTKEVESLKKQNMHLSEKIAQQDRLGTTVEQVENDFLKFKNATSSTLSDLKIEVRYISITLLDLNKHMQETNETASLIVQNAIRNLSNANVAFKDFQKNVSSTITELMDTSINDVRTELMETQKSQLKLFSSLSSLEAFRYNISNKLNDMKTKVGFTAGLTSSSSSWTGTTLVFPKIISNNGGCYSSQTGIFTSPKDATFVFFVTITAYDTKYGYVHIRVNDDQKVDTYTHSTPYSTASNLVVVNLIKGDRVWVQRSGGTGYYTHSTPLVTFSGFMI